MDLPTVRMTLDGVVLDGTLDGARAGRIVIEPVLAGGDEGSRVALGSGRWRIDDVGRDGGRVVLAVSAP